MLGYKLKFQQGFQENNFNEEGFVVEDSVSRSQQMPGTRVELKKSRTQSMHIRINKWGSPRAS